MLDVEAIYRQAREQAGRAPGAHAVPSAVVVPWRTAACGQTEVFLVERAPGLRFLGGYWCFPGGRIDPADADGPAAAARELREEVGLDVAAGRLRPLGRFVTPGFWPLRFDASYSLLEVGPDEALDAGASGGELVAGTWATPAAALARFASGAWLMPAPVIATLEALAPGVEGAEARLAAVVARADNRAWRLAAGVAVSMLETPTLPPAAHTGCYLIGDREVVAIDPGSPWPLEQAALAAEVDRLADAGRRLVAVLLTHHHGDHVGGAAALAAHAGVPVWAHAETARRLSGQVAIDRHLADGDLVELAGPTPRRLRAVFTPGHAPGHLCFHEEVTGFLVAGDMVASIGTILIDPSEGDMAEYLASLERLAALAPRALLPAHGAPIPDPQRHLAAYLEHRRWREGRIVAALAERPDGSAALTARAYHDTPTALHPLAERSLLAHLVKLEREGRARRDGEVWALA